ncbi:AMP-binding protein [Kaustia mangrovi]|uniref:AMP-binding protein n=1 Tax=Kaustia mangrovi TaxID=2593653 RepID=A0A7S8C5D7_9HYPH|nr:AMP-binding protein [Kaustia mangrovi]QPC43712.1 AMP-binding protein [Kaustia mangrovi]
MPHGEETALGALVDAADGHAAALVHDGRTITYGEISEASRRVAGGLARLGIARGDRVAIWLPNTPDWLVAFLALARLGAVAVSVNTRFRSAEVEDIVGRSGCRALILWPGFRNIDFAGILAGVAPAALALLDHVVTVGDAPRAPLVAGAQTTAFADLLKAEPLEADEGGPDHPCLIFTTSGTTSKPKFVLHRQGALAAHARHAATGLGYREAGTVLLQLLPFCGTFGLTQALAGFAAGRPAVLQTVFDAQEAVRLIAAHGVTQFNASDEMIARLVAAAEDARAFQTVRFCGFARFSGEPGIVEAADAKGLAMVGLFGMSETHALFAVQPRDDPERRTLAGGVPVVPGARVRAVDPETGETLADGETGMLEILSPTRMVGYFGNAEATREAIAADGYFRTGDLGYTTGDGGFVFVGRGGDALRLGGFLVSPAEIEAHLETHPAVKACAVVAGSGALAGKAVAFVETAQAPADEEALRAFCAKRLARFKVPARLFAVDELPRVHSANGAKILRNVLRDWAAERTRTTPEEDRP